MGWGGGTIYPVCSLSVSHKSSQASGVYTMSTFTSIYYNSLIFCIVCACTSLLILKTVVCHFKTISGYNDIVNIDLLKVNDLKFNEEYFHDILSAGYIPTITLPTRLSVSSSLIDNIFTTNLSNDISACILNVHISVINLLLYFAMMRFLYHKQNILQ